MGCRDHFDLNPVIETPRPSRQEVSRHGFNEESTISSSTLQT